MSKDDDINKKVEFDNFMERVKEDVRKENYERLWNKYGKAVSVIAGILILGASIYSYWQKQDMADKEAISERFTVAQNALAAERTQNAITNFREISKVSKKNYAMLAKFEYAALLRDKNDIKVLDQYQQIFNDEKIDKSFRDLSYIYYVNSALDLMPDSDLKNKLPQFIKRLSEYVEKSWDLIAKETLAYCYIKLGEKAKAKSILQSLATTTNIPASMLERARELIQFLNER